MGFPARLSPAQTDRKNPIWFAADQFRDLQHFLCLANTMSNKSLNEYGESPSNRSRWEIHIQWMDFFRCSPSTIFYKMLISIPGMKRFWKVPVSDSCVCFHIFFARVHRFLALGLKPKKNSQLSDIQSLKVTRKVPESGSYVLQSLSIIKDTTSCQLCF